MTKGTVLVVDDEPTIVDLVTHVLTEDGYAVHSTLGSLILPLARARRPDVILLDIMMPGQDGIAVSRHLHADPRTAAIPVIAVSAVSDLHVRAAAMGADDCLAKPFDLDELVQCVDRWVGTHGPNDAADSDQGQAAGATLACVQRPSPQDVRGWFAGYVTADALVAYVTTLRADPNWRVEYVPGPPFWTMHLTYWPTGENLHVALERLGAVWRTVTCSAADDLQ